MAMLQEAIKELEGIEFDSEVEGVLREIARHIGAANIAYMAAPHSAEPGRDTVRFVTYSKEWEKRYFDREYIEIDPIARGVDNSLPFDWHSATKMESIRWLFMEAESFGVGRQGVSVPIRGDAGERALLTLTSFHSAREWRAIRWNYQAFISALAPYLHQLAYRLKNLQPTQIVLSVRQHQCLELYGRGNTPKQIAAQLGVSGSMAREHLHCARRKMGCRTISAAAVKATNLKIVQI